MASEIATRTIEGLPYVVGPKESEWLGAAVDEVTADLRARLAAAEERVAQVEAENAGLRKAGRRVVSAYHHWMQKDHGGARLTKAVPTLAKLLEKPGAALTATPGQARERIDCLRCPSCGVAFEEDPAACFDWSSFRARVHCESCRSPFLLERDMTFTVRALPAVPEAPEGGGA